MLNLPAPRPGHFVDPLEYANKSISEYPSTPVWGDSEYGIDLVPVLPRHYEFLYALALADKNSFRWRYRNQFPAFETFVQQIPNDVFAHFIVEHEGFPSGYVVAYNSDLRSRTVHLGVVMCPDYVGRDLGLRSLVLLRTYVSRTFGFRKVIVELPEFTFRTLVERQGKIDGWAIEGVLKEMLFCDGKFWDTVLLAWNDFEKV